MLTSSTSTRLLVTVMLVLVAAAAGAQSEFRPGEVWLDTDGKPIQACVVRATSLPIDSAKRGIIVRWCFIRADCSV